MRRAATVLAIALACVLSRPACAEEAAKPAAVTRISYWTTKPGKQAEAHGFWKPFAQVFEEMKKKGHILDWRFVTPAIHTGQDWDLAYIWTCRDMAAYGQADQYFADAVGKLDMSKVESSFDAVFDGSKHRDEIWREVTLE